MIFTEQRYISISDKIYTLHPVIFRNVKMGCPMESKLALPSGKWTMAKTKKGVIYPFLLVALHFLNSSNLILSGLWGRIVRLSCWAAVVLWSTGWCEAALGYKSGPPQSQCGHHTSPCLCTNSTVILWSSFSSENPRARCNISVEHERLIPTYVTELINKGVMYSFITAWSEGVKILRKLCH